MKTFNSESTNTTNSKLFGQPTPETHPHLLNNGELTPLITPEEYQTRREKLVQILLKYAEKKCAEKKHVVCLYTLLC